MMFRRSPRAAGLLLVAAAVLAATGLAAQGGGPSAEDSKTAELVARMVERFHISHKGLDDEVSKKTFDKYLSDLDPMKLYFLQSDIDEFAPYATRLDDLTLEGKTDFAHVAFGRYLERLGERIGYAQELIDAEHDFAADEAIVVDSEDLPWAKSLEEVNDRWRKRIKYDVLSLKLDDTPIEEIRERLHKRYHNIQVTAGQTEDAEKLELYLSALTHSFDPHSSYMSPNTLQDFQISMELRLEGIGAELRSEDGYVTVNRIVEGGAAFKDGRLKAGDKIIGVRQEGESKFTDVIEMKLTKVVQLIRGKADTKVTLQVKNAAGEIQEYELTRQQVELNDQAVRGEVIDTGKRIGERSYKVGVINIPSFYRDFQGAQAGAENFRSTTRDVLKVLGDFDRADVDAIVVDLRTNGGGALQEAIDVTGLFIDQGPVVQVKEQDGSVRSHDDSDPKVAYTGPLVVLCNRLSASASEIFAGAIKDYKRGIVIGDTTTHGKGTVQNVMPVPPKLLSFLADDESRGALKLTINQFYRVNGDSTQQVGVPSDVVLPSLLDHLDLGEQFLDNALPFDRVKAAGGYRPVPGLVGDGIVSTLRQQSAQRVGEDEEFQELNQEIVKFLERKEDKTISLNEATRRAEQAEAKDQTEIEEKLAEEEAGGDDKPIFPEGFYNDEVLHITADYLDQLKGSTTAGR